MVKATLPEFWVYANLGDVADIIGGGTPSRNNKSYFGGNILWATPTDVTKLSDIWIDETAECITEEGLINSSAKMLPVGTVLMTSRASIGFTAISRREMCTNQGFANFFCGEKVLLNQYLAYFLSSIKEHLGSLAGGTTFKEISKTTLAKLSIPLPPLSEQQRIVEILQQADELLRVRREADVKSEQLTAAIFQEMFHNPHNTWVEKKLGDEIGNLQPGRSLNGIDKPADEGKWGVLKVSAVTYGKFRPEENKELPESVIPNEDFEVRDGDLLISRANTEELVGASAFVRNPPKRLVLPDKLWRVVLRDDSEMNLIYLYALLTSPQMRIKISQTASGTSGSMKNISQGKFLSIRFKMPPKNLQEDFSGKIKALWNYVSQHQPKAKSKLQLLSTTILNRAFIGQLTKEWREANYEMLREEAKERDRKLGRAALAASARERFEAIEEAEASRMIAGRERYGKRLGEKQKELLSLALQLPRYFDALQIHSEQQGDERLARVNIEQYLALFAESGLLHRARVRAMDGNDNAVFAPVFRSLADNDISKLVDKSEIASELNSLP